MDFNTTIVSNDIPLENYQILSTKFAAHHRNSMNIFLHLLTTPLGFIGLYCLVMKITKATTPSVVLTSIYLISLLPFVPLGVLLGTALLLFTIIMISRSLKLGIIASLMVFAAGYILQDVAHLITNETTYQSTYSAGGQVDLQNLSGWSAFFTAHCYYLLPLCVDLAMPFIVPATSTWSAILSKPSPDALQLLYNSSFILYPLFIWAIGNYCLDSKNGFTIFPGLPFYNRVLRCSLLSNDSESKKGDLKAIRDWTMQQHPSRETSSHWWFTDLPEDARNAFDRCAKSSLINSMFRTLFNEKHYCVDVVEGMNEVYVTGPSRQEQQFNSDQIFYNKHVDGPWGLIPFVSVFRCIVGMDRNYMTATHFPMTKQSVFACEGDVVGFDFNREVHYITRDESRKEESDEFRVVLKLHYCAYPRVLAPLGWFMLRLNVWYNICFRALFLKTINPQSLYEHFLAWNVVVNTTLFNNLETYIGQRNVLYLICVAAVWYITGRYEIFFAATSFIHYFRYISTYYFRSGVDFGAFKRDVLLFKTLSLLQLLVPYCLPSSTPFVWDWLSLSMIGSGYLVSVLATSALGIERTYFGAELGICEPKWITAFPYGYIPHPMIVSQIWALLGIYKADHFRAAYPYAIFVHIALYLTHMTQEILNIHQKPAAASTSKTISETLKAKKVK